MTKIAFGCASLAHLAERLAARETGEVFLTTRYLPKRHAEMVGGSLYWIHAHAIVGRSPIVRFEAAPEGRTHIVIEARVIPVESRPKRAHQGWRYLTDADAPPDLPEGMAAGDAMPGKMAADLARLGLV